jgi:replicative DNA helicase
MMTEQIEKNILACFLMSDYAKTYLTRVKTEWFTDWHKGLVKTMQDMYINNEPIGIHTLYQHFKDRAMGLAQLTNSYVTDRHVEKELLYLEAEYNRTHLLAEITKVKSDWNLTDIQNHLEIINQNSRIKNNNQVQEIAVVMGKKIDEMEERVKSGNKMKGISTGWKSLDKYIGGWNKGNLVVVGGRPGMGKSALGLNFCIDGQHYAKHLFVSVEMSADELAERMLADLNNIENTKIRNANVTLSDLERMSQSIFNANFHIIDTKDNNVYNIISLLKVHRAKYGLDVVVIDYLQKLDAGGKDMRTNVGMASTALKNFARELGITVIALAQLNRDGKNARPELTELKESGQIEQDADVVLFPFRPSYYEEVKPDIEDAVVIVAKNRHGRLCDITCTFEGGLTRYKENL